MKYASWFRVALSFGETISLAGEGEVEGEVGWKVKDGLGGGEVGFGKGWRR